MKSSTVTLSRETSRPYPEGRSFTDLEPDPSAGNGQGDLQPAIPSLGIFYPTPTNDGAMARIRIPAGQLKARQLRALANMTEDLTTGYAQVTTRANLQVRVIAPEHANEFLLRLRSSTGLHPEGEGANSPRNVTAPPNTGFDPDELVDVSPFCHSLARNLVERPVFADLPRKFNLALDGGGTASVLDSANDVTARAVRVKDAPDGEDVRFRIGLGDRPLVHDLGVLVEPDRLVETLLAVVRVHVEQHDRSHRLRARMKHLVKKISLNRYLDETQRMLGRQLYRAPLDPVTGRSVYEVPRETDTDPHPRAGIFSRDGKAARYVAAALPVGQLTTTQMHGLADLAEEFGDGEIRLTTWQNVLFPYVAEERLREFLNKLEVLGLRTEQSRLRSGIVACTGSAHCPYGKADVKRHARELADHLDTRLALDEPVNIHFTGCPASCAQHYVGDVGLLAASDPAGDEIYQVFVGGGYGSNRTLGRHIAKNLPVSKLNKAIEGLLRTFIDQRQKKECFRDFANRQDIDSLASALNGKGGQNCISPSSMEQPTQQRFLTAND